QPFPTDPDAVRSGILYRFGAFPYLEPQDLRGYGLVRYRSRDPKAEDNAWFFNPTGRRLKRVNAESLSDTMGPSRGSVCAGMAGMGGGSGALGFANNIDPDSYFGFAAKVESFDYRLLGIRPMLASVHAASSPEKPCEFDGGRTVCPENWEMRVLYVVEATARGGTLSRRIGGGDRAIP